MAEAQRIVICNEKGEQTVVYEPLPHQVLFHSSNAPNLLALGTRGTGKSVQLRRDAEIRCLMFPNFRALIVRRTMPELRRSHLVYIDWEMKQLGGIFLQTTCLAKFPNGSTIQFAHCETQADVMNFLSSEYGAVYFDELSTFSLTQFLQVSAAARAPAGAPYRAVVRAGSNPLGVGASWMKAWFCDHDVNYAEYPDYHPDDFQMIFSRLEENPHLDRKSYTARLQNLPEHVRKAWLLGQFVVEGAYFTEFQPRKMVNDVETPWHVIPAMPTWKGQSIFVEELAWISIFRAVDWGYSPDPAVCLWIALFPNKWAVVFKERTWRRTLAKDVALEIKRESRNMHIVETFADPTMAIKTGSAAFSIGEQFEQNGVPLTFSQNDRELYGYAIHEQLNTLIDDHPQIQIVEHACPELVRTLPILEMDPTDNRKIGNGPDHWAIALAYYCLGQAMPSRDPVAEPVRRWMLPKRPHRMISGY